MFDKVDELGVNTIRTLSMDMIEKANSGHPGLPMGAAPMAYVLWTKHLKVNPKTSTNWVDRDRFILSAGHGSAMLYSLLHLAGYDVTIDDLKAFRQWESRTPGHPEVNHTDGVEATTGPLGQGIGMAVGMAMAEAHLAARYNQEDHQIVDHYTYALCGDGDLMEGVSQEAASLAGHLGLGKLVVLYDSNDISLDGPTSKAFTENVQQRFKANNWHYLRVEDGNDLEAIDQAIKEAKAHTDQPSLIEVKTVIGYGAPNAGSSAVHGAPLGKEGILAAKAIYQWENDDFFVPEEVKARFQSDMVDAGAQAEAAWEEAFEAYRQAYPDLARDFELGFSQDLPSDWAEDLPVYASDSKLASRQSSHEVLQVLSEKLPYLWGGAADLASSNKTMVSAEEDFTSDNYAGRNIWFGVREFAMAAAMNGIQLHGGSKVYGGTFFSFVDYLRPALRLAAIQGTAPVFVMTHDSVAVGEDGPTHEPIEQLASIRSIPNVQVIRPADANETVAAWKQAVETQDKPTVLVLSRQGLPSLENTVQAPIDKGAYIVSPAQADHAEADGLILATGSEVALAIEAQAKLAEADLDVAVVSMPSWDCFEAQDEAYKESILPSQVTARLAVEMSASFGWERYVGSQDDSLTIDQFGFSAPGDLIQEKLGFTADNVAAKMRQVIDNQK